MNLGRVAALGLVAALGCSASTVHKPDAPISPAPPASPPAASPRADKAEDALVGLWVGDYGPHGDELISISHSGSRVVAEKITGDANVPPGATAFSAADERSQYADCWTTIALSGFTSKTRAPCSVRVTSRDSFDVITRLTGQLDVTGEVAISYHRAREGESERLLQHMADLLASATEGGTEPEQECPQGADNKTVVQYPDGPQWFRPGRLTDDTISCEFRLDAWVGASGDSVYGYSSAFDEPMTLTFMNLGDKEPSMKGTVGSTSVLKSRDDGTQIALLEITDTNNTVQYVINRETRVAAFSKTYFFNGKLMAYHAVGYCY